MPNNRETNNLSNLETIGVESINAANAIDNDVIVTARPVSYCLICGEFFSCKHQGYKFYVCDDFKNNTIKFMKEVKKRLIERKGKYNESKQSKK